MILLLEDRKRRKEQFISNNEQFPMICEKPFDCSKIEELESYLLENFQEAKVILLHKSYEFKCQEMTPDNFKKISQKTLQIPVVLFSGGSNSNLIQERNFVTAEVNSGVMYKNLRFFHDEYQETGIVNIPLLVYGTNYRLNQLMEMQAKIILYFFNRNYSHKLNMDDKYELEEITDVVRDEKTRERIERMWNWVEEKGAENVTINSIITLVHRITNQQ